MPRTSLKTKLLLTEIAEMKNVKVENPQANRPSRGPHMNGPNPSPRTRSKDTLKKSFKKARATGNHSPKNMPLTESQWPTEEHVLAMFPVPGFPESSFMYPLTGFLGCCWAIHGDALEGRRIPQLSLQYSDFG